MKKKLILLVLSAIISSCTWVELTKEGKNVAVLSETQVKNCKFLGKTTVSIKADIARIERNKEKVAEELEILARNNAVNMNGDAIVAITEVNKGQQVFNVYRCRI